MALIYPLKSSFGINIELQHSSELKETIAGKDVINITNIQPRLKFDVSRAIISQEKKDELEQFFIDNKGSEDVFLFEDYSDNKATQLPDDNNTILFPLAAGYERGFTQGFVIQDSSGNLRLCKKYEITGIAATNRAITRPNNDVVVYSGGVPLSPQPTIDPDTGIVTGNASNGDTWEGSFKVPVRFAPQEISLEKRNDCIYSYATQLIEVKENTARLPHTITRQIGKHFSIGFNFGSQVEKAYDTDIYETKNELEDRVQRRLFVKEVYRLQDRNILNYSDIQYLITIYRCCQGSGSIFDLYQFDSGDTTEVVCFDKGINYKVISENDNFDYLIFGINDLTLKNASDILIPDPVSLANLRTYYCHCWEITRNDGAVFRYTDHDEDVQIGINTYEPYLIKGSAYNKTSDLEVKNMEFQNIFSASIDPSDLIAGRFDNGRIKVIIADWTSQAEISVLFNGYIGDKTLFYDTNGYRRYKVEVISLTRNLNRAVTFVTSATCGHRFLSQGLGKCNLQTTVQSNPSPDFTNVQVRTTISSITGNTIFNTNTTGDWARYVGGRVEFETGKLFGKEYKIRSGNGSGIEISSSFLVNPEIGDQVLITKRCNKLLNGNCTDYGNQRNFLGHPSVPGNPTLASPVG